MSSADLSEGNQNYLPSQDYIRKKLVKFISEEILLGDTSVLSIFGDNLENGDRSLDSLGIQSLDLMELLFFIERTFNCKLPADLLRADSLYSVNSIVKFVHKFLLEPSNSGESCGSS
ncbi:MAG TPA: acyl carrier protein [Oligoflexia bacterium]|nr:acyl carrier protein [Oligoflexia bacterium]HMP49867.1 acyl carrier protein [Oligoflexia bacterium]